MTRYRAAVVAGLVLVLGLVAAARVTRAQGSSALPTSLTDQEFWDLSNQLSEPNGYFRSDNLLSNEMGFQWVIPDLVARAKPGGVYLGVGPEQNFSYIAALKPKMVFITDIRRGNLWTQLMYKALFEMSADRADFVGRLFTKKRPDGLTTQSTGKEIMDKYWDVSTGDEATFKKNSQDIIDLLTKKHHIPLPDEDRKGIIDDVYYYFYWYGPSINYNSSSGSNNGRGGGGMAMYYDLMTTTDLAGVSRAYLANEDNFHVLKDLEDKNLLVPVVGDFGGPKALRAVGQYVRDHSAVVMAMYLSNVEQYLTQDGKWSGFCGNVASMPLDEHSTFIRSASGGGGGRGGSLQSQLGSMQADTQGCK
jgi:hypothetical protein